MRTCERVVRVVVVLSNSFVDPNRQSVIRRVTDRVLKQAIRGFKSLPYNFISGM